MRTHAAGKYGSVVVLLLAVTLFGPVKSVEVQAHTQSVGTAGSIQVRGHWKIDVRNPDGTLDSHTEFDNALTPQGQAMLVAILNGQALTSAWFLTLNGQSLGDGSCLSATGSLQVCVTAEPGLAPNAYGGTDGINHTHFVNLERTAAPANGTFTLSGWIRVTRTDPGLAISHVSSGTRTCLPTATPAECRTFLGAAVQFTSHQLSQLVGVTNGQIVQLNVTFSFMAGPSQ